MHDYDRRPVTAATNASESTLHVIDFADLIRPYLQGHSTRVDKLEARQVKDTVFALEGTTIDGRSFTGEVTLTITNRGVIKETTSMQLSGAVAQKPLPPELERVEEALLLLFKSLESLGHAHSRKAGFDILKTIELWKAGAPVDTELGHIRDQLRMSEKFLPDIPDSMRQTVPQGQKLPMWKLFEAAGKAIRAAIRTLK